MSKQAWSFRKNDYYEAILSVAVRKNRSDETSFAMVVYWDTRKRRNRLPQADDPDDDAQFVVQTLLLLS